MSKRLFCEKRFFFSSISYPQGKLIVENDFNLPGFGDRVNLKIFESSQVLSSPRNNPYGLAGILIKTKSATLDNRLFRFENDPAAHYFFGEALCLGLESRLRKGETELVDPNRGGLEWRHNYCQVLAQSIEEALEPLVGQEKKELEKKPEMEVNESIKKMIRNLCSLLNELAKNELSEAPEVPIMDAAEYKHVVLGIIFLKCISDSFEEHHARLETERASGADPEDPDEYRSLNIFWVPREARWSLLKGNAVQPTIGRLGDIAIYGQESNYTTWRLAKMNLAIRGIDGHIAHGDSFHNDRFPDLRADYILANPPFNVSDWRGDLLKEDKRWKYGVPPVGNANFAWVQHMIYHLAPTGLAGFVLANGSMSSNQSGEGEIRKNIIEADLVDCMMALPGQLFYSTQIPACLWFLARDKKNSRFRDRRGEVLFIDARKMGRMVDRTHRELTDEDIARIAGTYHTWRSDKGPDKKYADVPGFCKAAPLEEIRKHGYVLTPGRYVGAEAAGQNIITLGDGNQINAKFSKLGQALVELCDAISQSDAPEVDKMSLVADIDTIQSQLAKPNPNRTIVSAAWDAVKAGAAISGLASIPMLVF